MIDKIIENLLLERNAESVTFPTEEAIKEHKEQSDFLIKLLEKEKTNGWIPCSERLPELRQDCLVTVKYSGFMGMYGTWIKTGHMEAENDWWGDCSGGTVIAWQPLPAPWKGLEDGKI